MNTDRPSQQNSGKHAPLTEAIIRIFYDVYKEIGHGFLESVYHEAMLIGLREAGIAAVREQPVPVTFRGQNIGIFKADIIVNECVLLELKAVTSLEPVFEAQVLHYLRATNIEVGLLLNFGPKPQIRRFILDNEKKKNL